jgi:hypothetical protein
MIKIAVLNKFEKIKKAFPGVFPAEIQHGRAELK